MKRHLLFFALIYCCASITASGPESLDTSFNGDGSLQATFSSGSTTIGFAIVMQDDGKILVGGQSGSSTSSFVARYNNDGSADTTFNSSGTPGYIIATTISSINGLAIQPDGKILVTGPGLSPYASQAVTIRYLSTGLIDTSFGTSGIVATSTMTTSNAITLQDDGNIIIAGKNSSSGIIMRYTTDGVLDTTFGTSGSVATAIGTSATASGVKLQTDGSIVITGQTTISSVVNALVARYTTDGTLDTSFGTSGYVTTTLGNNAQTLGNALVIQDDQKIIVVGRTVPGSINYGFIMRLNTDGAFDTSFNSVGYTTGTSNTRYLGVTIQTNQQTIACGSINSNTIIVTRYNTDGTVDSSCDITASDVSGTNNNAQDIVVQTDQKIIISGSITTSSFNSGQNALGIVRWLGGFTPSSGRTTTINTYGYNSAYISEFLYVDFYATVISDTTARAAAIDAVNVIIDSFATSYVNQSSFNFISYAYLMNEDLLAAEELLASNYPSSSTEIAQFFEYIFARETQLLE
ncbi:MAG: hypothetical protein Q8Q60_04675 [Candidatus Chromulinivorax sp.]|nr:hypothetical protein [Candidatus Chromulinivorax sp.]